MASTSASASMSASTGASVAARANLARVGENVFKEVEKINAELFTLTYGSIVTQLLKDYEDIEEVNTQLETMGYNIGQRLIEEFLARSNIPRCHDFKDTAEVIAKVGFKMFLGVTAQVANWDTKNNEFSLILEDNPLTEFVELPENFSSSNFYYSNILCGVVRGALEMLQMRVECKFVRCVLRGDDASEIKVTLKEMMLEEIPVGDD
eukprot:TRINITY_DN5703_c0_g1_i2.p1 TRINITY_DN5703_c0_g1~~TRINITY_DN5703_c0_g1_i2.p1  ORF type:complete len:215 (-),score=28.10 TRINITY_DN5703_c0_g1_i2:166-786(-)